MKQIVIFAFNICFLPLTEIWNLQLNILIAAKLEKRQSEFEQIIADWFEKGKPLKEAFFENLHLNMENPEIETESQKHESWKEKSQLRATPTVLVNGYKLPDNYKVEDLKYFTEFNVNVK